MTDTAEIAILAGGCFWGMQDLIRKRPGVITTRVGYTGGNTPNATYRKHPGHAEALEIIFDPAAAHVPRSPRVLLPNPRSDHQGPSGRRLRQRLPVRHLLHRRDPARVAEDTIADVDASGLWPGKVVTEVTPAGPFWEAEPEHQDYLEHYPNGYTCHFVRDGWKLPRRAEGQPTESSST